KSNRGAGRSSWLRRALCAVARVAANEGSGCDRRSSRERGILRASPAPDSAIHRWLVREAPFQLGWLSPAVGSPLLRSVQSRIADSVQVLRSPPRVLFLQVFATCGGARGLRRSGAVRLENSVGLVRLEAGVTWCDSSERGAHRKRLRFCLAV